MIYRVFLIIGMSLAFGKANADVFSLFGTGAESKAAAGAGQLASRGAPANYYNPANLVESPRGIDPYFSLDINQITYSYEYPDYDPVKVQQIAPIPFMGIVYRPQAIPQLAVGGSFLVLPAGAGKQKIKQLPVKLTDSDDPDIGPQLVNVESGGGKSMGYRGSFGAAYRVISGLTLGVSFLASAGESVAAASNVDTDEVVLRSGNQSKTQEVILGVRGQALNGRITGALTLRPGSNSTVKSRTELPTLGPEAVLEKNTKVKGPRAVGAAVEGRVWRGLSPFVELVHEQWGALRSQVNSSGLDEGKSDYFNTTDTMVGATYIDGPNKMIGGYGIYQSHLGDGIWASQSADGEALIGQEFANIDGLPYEVYAFGYSRRYAKAQLTTVVSYAAGHREVWEKAKGYGSYSLQILSLTFGWEHQL